MSGMSCPPPAGEDASHHHGHPHPQYHHQQHPRPFQPHQHHHQHHSRRNPLANSAPHGRQHRDPTATFAHHHFHHHHQQHYSSHSHPLPHLRQHPPHVQPHAHPVGTLPSVQLRSAPPPPPPSSAQAAPQQQTAGAPARSIQPDAALVDQFLTRYAHQGEHEAIAVGAVIGFLDVDECLKVIAANDVTFVVTDTGTGKSSLVPNALLDQQPDARIANSQPRRTAAINLANRVASLRHEKVGNSVGYWVRGERSGTVDKCRLMYMTSYTLLLHIIGHPHDLNFTHVIIDEFHERQPDVEVMLGLLKQAVTTQKLRLKLILMSASVELELWKKYFDGLKVGEYATCQPRYSIHDYYQEEVCRLVGMACNATKLSASGAASSLELKNNLLLGKELLRFLAGHAEPKDSILMFLPGRTVVEDMRQWILSHLSEQLDPIPWYRDMELNKIQANLRRLATTRKKVYLATDIAEVSITLPDVVFVVDLGFTKKPRIDPNNRNSVVFPPLDLLWCSRSSNRQRRGRVGRVQQGFFFTMIPECYLADLIEMEPQISNSTIHELSLHTLQLCNNPMGCFNLCRVTPKSVSLQFSMSVLQDGGYVLRSDHPLAVTEGVECESSKAWRDIIMQNEHNASLQGESYVTTLRGRIAQRLPLNIESSSMVYLGLVFGIESTMILAAAICSAGTPFYSVMDEDDRMQKKKATDETRKVMLQYSHKLPSDIVAALAVTVAFKRQRMAGLSDDGEERWCLDNCVMRSRLCDIVNLETQIKEQLAEQISFVDVSDPVELEDQLAKFAPLISLLAAGAHLERALFVQFDSRRAQKEKKVGPSIFLGLDALADLFVASVCPWEPQHVVIPLSIQTRYEKLLGAFATQLTPKIFNVILLLLAPQVVFERRDGACLFGVELFGTKLRMKSDRQTGDDLLAVRSVICAKMRLLRYQLLHRVGPTDPSLDEELLRIDTIKLPSSVDRAVHVGPFLRYCAHSIVNTVMQDSTRDVSPSQDLTFCPTKVSLLVSCGNGVIDRPVPPVNPTAAPQPAAAAAGPVVEDNEDDE